MAKHKFASIGEKLKRDFSLVMPEDTPRIVIIPLENIDQNPDQPRKVFDKESIEELAASIASHGLIQPITVKRKEGEEGLYVLVAGERRYRAHQLLLRADIYAVVTKGSSDEIALIENLQREDLKPIEEAEALQRLMERHSYGQEELGNVVGKKRITINELLRLNTLPEQIKAECRTSDTPKTVLIEIARLATAAQQLSMWEQAKKGGVTVRAVREKKGGNEDRATPPPTTRMLSAVRRAAKELTSIQAERLTLASDQLEELITLQRSINDTIATLAKRQGEGS